MWIALWRTASSGRLTAVLAVLDSGDDIIDYKGERAHESVVHSIFVNISFL